LAFLRAEKPELAELIDSWENLPPAVRLGIVAMVQAAREEGSR
jgi:hypothetical protein